MEISGSSVPASSTYFTSIFLPSAAEQNKEIRLKDMGHTSGINGANIIYSGLDDTAHGELRINGIRPPEERYVGGQAVPQERLC